MRIYHSDTKGLKYIGKTKFRHVYKMVDSCMKCYYNARIVINKKRFAYIYDNLREAAKAIDLIKIKNGEAPVNILVKK